MSTTKCPCTSCCSFLCVSLLTKSKESNSITTRTPPALQTDLTMWVSVDITLCSILYIEMYRQDNSLPLRFGFMEHFSFSIIREAYTTSVATLISVHSSFMLGPKILVIGSKERYVSKRAFQWYLLPTVLWKLVVHVQS